MYEQLAFDTMPKPDEEQTLDISPPRIAVQNRPTRVARSPHFYPFGCAAGDGCVGVG